MERDREALIEELRAEREAAAREAEAALAAEQSTPAAAGGGDQDLVDPFRS